MVLDAFHDQKIQEQIKFTLLRVLRDPEFKAEITKQMISVSGDPILQESVSTMAANVVRDERIQNALSEIAGQTLSEVMSNKEVSEDVSTFLSKVIHLSMQDYRLYKMFFGSNEEQQQMQGYQKPRFTVSPEKRERRNSRSRDDRLSMVIQKVNESPVDLSDFSSRIRGYELGETRSMNSRLELGEAELKDMIKKKMDSFDGYVVHKDSAQKREDLKAQFNKNVHKMNQIEKKENDYVLRRYMPGEENQKE